MTWTLKASCSGFMNLCCNASVIVGIASEKHESKAKTRRREGVKKMERERGATDGSHTCEVGGVKEKYLIMFKGSFLDCCFKTYQCAA